MPKFTQTIRLEVRSSNPEDQKTATFEYVIPSTGVVGVVLSGPQKNKLSDTIEQMADMLDKNKSDL